MHVAVAQMPSLQEGVVDMMEPLVRRAAGAGASLVVFPEGVMHDFHPSVDLSAVAEPLDGPFASSVRMLAQRHAVTIVAGMWERDPEDPRPWNTVIAVDAAGDDLIAYRKIHLFDSFGWRESDRVIPGPLEPAILELADLRVGFMTCYDLRFPELARALSSSGVDLILVPAGWVAGPGKLHHWVTLLTARAIENTAYVGAAGLCQSGYTGHSRIIDPMGETLASLEDEPGVATAAVTAERIAEVRKVLPSLAHRRL